MEEGGGGIEIYFPLRKGKDRCFDEVIDKDTQTCF